MPGNYWTLIDKHRYTCPANYTLSGTTCTLNAPACVLSVGTHLYDGYFDVGTTPSGVPPSSVCKTSCLGVAYLTGPVATALVDGVKHYYYSGSYQVDTTWVGGYCSPDTPLNDVSNSGSTVPTSTCGVGQSVGYINGIPVCYDSVTPTPTVPPASTTQNPPVVTNNPDGSTTTTNTTNKPDGSSTTVNQTCTVAGACTTTTTENPPPDPLAAQDFCATHPTDPNCTAGKAECELHPGTLGCMLPGDVSAAEGLPIESPAVSFTSVVFASDMSCPVSLDYQIFGTTYFLAFQPACDFLAT